LGVPEIVSAALDGRWRVLVLLLVAWASCERSGRSGGDGTETDGETIEMPASADELPNYLEVPQSPAQDGPGVAIRLAPGPRGGAYSAGEPIVLHGKYGADAAADQRADGSPLTRLIVRVGKVGEDQQTERAVQESHNLPPAQEPPAGGDYVVYGYFNLDLAKFSKLPREPGRYWVSAELFEYKSRKLEFEVR
jgi:hypothetical protein